MSGVDLLNSDGFVDASETDRSCCCFVAARRLGWDPTTVPGTAACGAPARALPFQRALAALDLGSSKMPRRMFGFKSFKESAKLKEKICK